MTPFDLWAKLVSLIVHRSKNIVPLTTVIQRIQHVLLLLAVLLNVAFFFSPLFARATEDPASWIVSAVFAGIGIASLVALIVIFLYKTRNHQISWLRRGLLFQVLGLGASTGVLFSMGGVSINHFDEGLSVFLPTVSLVLMIVSLIYIRKDERLVRSMDRLR